MGIIQNAVMAETRSELESLLKKRPNWTLSDEYETIFLFRFGSEARMNCTLQVKPNGLVRWCCARASANGQRIGHLSDRDFFPTAAGRCVEFATDEILPFLSGKFDDKEMIRIALFKAVQTARSNRRFEATWRDDLLSVARKSLESSSMPVHRKAGWSWFLSTVEFLRDHRPGSDYREICTTDGRQWLRRLSLCRYAEQQFSVLRDAITPKIEDDLYRHGWYRDNADFATMLLADGLI